MARILISWMALENDFTKGKLPVNATGPNSSVHKHSFNYDYHLLLTSSKNAADDTKYQHLVSFLRNTYKQNRIIEMAMGINDVIDIKEISAKVNTLLLEHSGDEMEIFISPGTPTMQVAWYFAHQSLGLNTKLFQLRKTEHNKTGEPQKLWIDLEKSSYTSAIIIKQHALDNVAPNKEVKISESLKNAYQRATRIASYDHIKVLITGETGTGKELLAKYIHENSPRRKKRFEAINCSALNDQLLESRLFGYVKGAFTGAIKDMPGLFHELDGGTIFMDEIGDITSNMQQALLRVVQSGEILRVGSRKSEQVDVRIISATNKNLAEMCHNHSFRDDLYYRLSVAEIKLPSLSLYKAKEKEEMFEFLWDKCKKRFNKKEPRLTAEIRKRILGYSFPGNIREMENMIDGIMAESEDVVKEEHLSGRIIQPRVDHSLKLADVERLHIKKVYEMCNGNAREAQRILGIKSANTLKAKIKSIYGDLN